MKDIYEEISSKGVHYGDMTKQIMNLFSRQEERGANVTKQDDKFFSQLWQAYAWTAIIGFIKDKREVGIELNHKTSFKYFTVLNNSDDIANALILMAISKVKGDTSKEILNTRNLLTIISEYAEGGAKHILEIRETQPTKFNHTDDFLYEIIQRVNNKEKELA
ncbi:MAG TPA: hypothetical protein VK027_06330 [Chitinophagaceae bacterium]|nr:hypothetical protein [Chitinophagaceae bacterium]